MRLTILGGGGFRVPLIHRALLADREPGRVGEVALFEPDAGRLSTIAAVLAEQAAGVRDAPIVSLHTDLVDAIRGAGVIFSAIRVGGLAGRRSDETIPLRHGLIVQETVGAGGIAYGLRTLPVALEIARVIARVAPEAWVINFTNPAGMITEALQAVLGDRVIGICDSPVGLARRAWKAIEVRSGEDAAGVDYVGLNHLGWVRRLMVDGVDRLPDLLADPDRIESFEEGRLFGADWIRALGALPNEYLHHYYFAREALAADRAASASRADVLASQQEAFYGVPEPSAPGALERWEAARLARERTYMAGNRHASGGFARGPDEIEGGGYERVALQIIHAIAHDRPATLILNRPNGSRLAELDAEAVIEAPCRADAGGVHPLPLDPLPLYAVGLVTQVKQVERMTIAAAASRSRTDAWRAMASHPLVDSVRVARQVLDELIAEVPGLAYLR